MERLLRRLIGHPNRPGILYMHYWPAARFQPPFLNDEDLVDILLKYYGIPTLSLKNAIHGLLIETPQLIDEIWWPEPDDKVHPTCIGARHGITSLPLGILIELLSLDALSIQGWGSCLCHHN